MLLCKQDLHFPNNTNVKDFHSLWITSYLLEVHVLLFLFIFPLSHITMHRLANMNQYDCVGFLSALYPKLLSMKHPNYSCVGLIICSDFSKHLEQDASFFTGLCDQTPAPSAISLQKILTHPSCLSIPHTLIFLLFLRHTGRDILSTWKHKIFPHS